MVEKLLLVDDDEGMNYLHHRILEKSGLVRNVLVKNNGHEALKYLRDNEDSLPELIFFDINMPVMGGWDIVEELIKVPLRNLENSKIYILTSSINPEDFDRAEKNQIVRGIIEKYLSEEKLRAVINN